MNPTIKRLVLAGLSPFVYLLAASDSLSADETVGVIAKWREAPATKFDVFMVNMSLSTNACVQDAARRYNHMVLWNKLHSDDPGRQISQEEQPASYISQARYIYLPQSDSFFAQYWFYVSPTHPIMKSEFDETGERLRTDLTNRMLREACQATCVRVSAAAASAYPAGETGAEELKLFAAAICGKTTVEVDWCIHASRPHHSDEITFPLRLRQKNVATRHYLATSSIDVDRSTPNSPHIMGIEFDTENGYWEWATKRRCHLGQDAGTAEEKP